MPATKRDHTNTHLIDALKQFGEAHASTGDSPRQIDNLASGLLSLTMALQNINERMIDIEKALDVPDSEY